MTQEGRTPRDYYDNTQLIEITKVRQRIQDVLSSPIPEPKLATSSSHHMYISTNLKTKRVPPPTTIDGKYVAEHLGTALTLALAEIADCRPWDPIEYLGQWLYKYRENRNYIEKVRASLSLSLSSQRKSENTFNSDNYCNISLTSARAADERDSRGGEADGSSRERTGADQRGAEIHHGGGATGTGESGGREETEGEGGTTKTV